EITLCVDVATAGGQPLLSEAQVDQAIAEANRIWGCPGQCCIRFRRTTLHQQAPRDVVLRDGDQVHVAGLRSELRARRRDRGCWPVMIVGQIQTGTAAAPENDLGTTISHGEAGSRGTVVSTQ